MEDYGYDLLIDKSVDRETYIRDQKRFKRLALIFKIIDILKLVLAFLLGMVISTLI